VWILWDPSLAFGAFTGGAQGSGSQTSLSVLYSAAQQQNPGGQLPPANPGGIRGGGGRPLFTRLMEVPQYKKRYGQIYRWLAAEYLAADQVTTRMKVLHDMIRPWVARDTQKLNTMEQFETALAEDQTLNNRPGGAPGGGGLGGISPGLDPFFR